MRRCYFKIIFIRVFYAQFAKNFCFETRAEMKCTQLAVNINEIDIHEALPTNIAKVNC